jgi:hypothetical protein
MNWRKAAISALIGGFVIALASDMVLLATGDCGIGAAAKAIALGTPIGNVLGIGVYGKFSLSSIAKAGIAGRVLAVIFAALAAIAGLYAMDVLGIPGLLVALLAPCLGSLSGYGVGLRAFRRP